MIGVIGAKRLIVLFVLLVINGLLGAVIYLYLMPEQITLDRDLMKHRRQLSAVQGDIDRMQLEFEQLDKQQDEFDALKASGFFSNQDRGDAKKLFSQIQDDSKVISAVVNVRPGIVEDDVEAMKANHKVLVSAISIEIKAFDDGDVYRYIELMQQRFPGHLSLGGVEFKRIRDISSPVLRAIASGANPEMIEARIDMTWRTLISQGNVIGEGAGR